MALGPLTFADFFDRSGTNDWGSSDSGHTWNGESTYHDVSTSGYATITVPTGAPRRIVYVDEITDTQSSQEALFKVKWNTTNLTDHGPIIRREDNNHYYYVRIQDFYHEIAINAWVNGVAYELDRATGVTLEKNTYYWVRFRADSGGLKVRIWAEGATEPGSWTLTSGYFDGAEPPGGGDFGYYAQGTDTTHTVYIDTAYWYTLEDGEPSFPVTDGFARLVDKGWGLSDSDHLWEGHFADDPTVTSTTDKGRTFQSGYGSYTGTSSAVRYGLIGPSGTDMEALAQVYSDRAGGVSEFRLGVRASLLSGASPSIDDGYVARLIYGSTSFQIARVDNGVFTTLGSPFTLSAAPAAGEFWWIKIQAVGTTIKAKAWKNGTAEPAFQITTTSSVYSSGKTLIGLKGETSGTTDLRVYDISATDNPSSDATWVTTGTLSTSSVTDDGFSITATYTNDTNNNSTCALQYRRQGLSTWQNATVSTDRTLKKFTSTVSGLDAGEVYEVRATYSDANGVTGSNPKTTTVTTALRGLDTGALEFSTGQTAVAVIASYTNDSDSDSSATVEYRVSPAGAWSAPEAMTLVLTEHLFSKVLSGLTADTTYEVRVTFSDPDEVRGTNPITGSVTTLGRAVQLDTISTVVSETSAIVTVNYSLDTNEDSEIAIQYRSIREQLWTTVPPQAVTTDRTNTRFKTILTGLRPNLTYEVEATASDPDGVVAGTSDTISATFTTSGPISAPDTRSKHYVFKVYDHLGEYKGTWHDAPEPEFSWHENGGVSDMSVTLPRTISQLNNDPTIDYGNRVDVWALDGSSDGFGANLLLDTDMDLGSWALGTSWEVEAGGGPDDSTALKFSSSLATSYQALSETINLDHITPLVVQAVAKARGGKIRMDLVAYDDADVIIDTSDETAETVGNRWQVLSLEWTPPASTSYVRVRLQNVGSGTMRIDKVKVLAKEVLIYRGRIETFSPKLTKSGESVGIEVLGLVSQLTDQYISFLQYVTTQPTKDANAGRPFKAPTDPANMMKEIIDFAQAEDPLFDLYYTDDSIKLTGETMEYTFRDQQIRSCFDKIRNLCPVGWHYFIEPDGKVWLRGPEHVVTHKLRLNVEVMEFENDKSVRNLKNYIIVKGRQDEDLSEPDGRGSINYVALDQESIDRYGLRVLHIRDANIISPEDAETVGEGRLEEHSVPEQRGRAFIPDEKDIRFVSGALRGFNIEAFRPGDLVQIKDPTSGENRTFWDQFEWDVGLWDSKTSRALPDDVPIRTVQYHGTHVILELSERQPSQVGDFARLQRWIQSQESDTAD